MRITLTMYTDGTTAFVTDEKSVSCLLAELQNFRKTSGLRTNIDKTDLSLMGRVLTTKTLGLSKF